MADKFHKKDDRRKPALHQGKRGHINSPNSRAPADNLGLIGRGNFRGSGEEAFRQHVDLLSNPSMSSPMYAQRKADLVRQIQRDYGNRYVQRLVEHVGQLRTTEIQGKMKVGPVGEQYEKEADRVAKEIVNSSGDSAQRQEEDEVQMRPLEIQRQEEEEEIQMLRRDGVASESADIGLEGGEIGRESSSALESAQGQGKRLPKNLRTRMEQGFGADFSGVTVHDSSDSDALSKSMSARAFTTGQDIFFAKGEYKPESSEGQETLAHELTHVVQQSGDELQRTIQRIPFNNVEAKFRTDNDDPNIENSEYHVTPTGYERYAPINKYRVPSQFFHEGDRSFMYFESAAKADKFYKYLPQSPIGKLKATENGGIVTFEYKDDTTGDWVPMPAGTEAKLAPKNGMEVYDLGLSDDGLLTGSDHFGHPVQNLGADLPELDQEGKVEELRILQNWLKHIIESKQLGQGKFTEADMLKAYQDRNLSVEEWQKYQKYVSYVEDLFGGLESELLENWSFWTL